MKLELAAFVICAFVPHVLCQFDPSFVLSMLNPDIKLPPKPPRSLFPRYYMSRQQMRQKQVEERRRQEMQIYRQLQNMTEAQILNLRKTLTTSQVQQLVQRLKYLKQQEQQQTNAGTGSGTGSGSGGGGSGSGSNLILSGASRVRRPGSSVNSVGGRGSYSLSGSSTSPRRAHRPMSPMQAMRYLTKYRKKGMSSMALGCTFPLMDPVNSFFAFAQRGCRGGGNSVCMMKAMSCVEAEKSSLCCPPGFTSATLDAVSYMKQMQAFMQQFQ